MFTGSLRNRKYKGSGLFYKLVFLYCLVGFSLAACQPPTATTIPITQIGAGEGQLNIISWPGYHERGENDHRYDWISGFEAETGCKVSVDVVSTSDEMVSLMNRGGYDLVTASGDASTRLISSGKVQAINTALIPSWDSLDPRLKDSPVLTMNSIHYGVPFQWGENVLMYNTEVFDGAPSSWDIVFEENMLPDGQTNKGRVQAYESPIYIADAALYLKYQRPELGISDPYELTREQFSAVIDLLRKQRVLVNRYWQDAFVQVDDFESKKAAISGSWPFQVKELKRAGQPIASSIPVEGVTGRMDSLMLDAHAPHPNCAYLWLEHSLDPKVQGDIAAWAGSNPSVPEGCQASELLGASGCEANGYNHLDRIFFWKTPDVNCENGTKACVPYSDWVTAYISIIGGQ
jgi:putative spermidine/putrescine transport system substrate-binding protein